ncbi:MarR family transcriptional regulator, partial [bacterium]|nr:MarR family transcriptional regulator [bacterium]
DRLEKNNLLKRIRSDSDRRVVYVEIVENFSKKHEIFGASFEKVLEDLLSDVDKDDIEKIYTGLSVLNYILDSKRNKGENLHD